MGLYPRTISKSISASNLGPEKFSIRKLEFYDRTVLKLRPSSVSYPQGYQDVVASTQLSSDFPCYAWDRPMRQILRVMWYSLGVFWFRTIRANSCRRTQRLSSRLTGSLGENPTSEMSSLIASPHPAATFLPNTPGVDYVQLRRNTNMCRLPMGPAVYYVRRRSGSSPG